MLSVYVKNKYGSIYMNGYLIFWTLKYQYQDTQISSVSNAPFDSLEWLNFEYFNMFSKPYKNLNTR